MKLEGSTVTFKCQNYFFNEVQTGHKAAELRFLNTMEYVALDQTKPDRLILVCNSDGSRLERHIVGYCTVISMPGLVGVLISFEPENTVEDDHAA